jgi:hypothetical protein
VAEEERGGAVAVEGVREPLEEERAEPRVGQWSWLRTKGEESGEAGGTAEVDSPSFWEEAREGGRDPEEEERGGRDAEPEEARVRGAPSEFGSEFGGRCPEFGGRWPPPEFGGREADSGIIS